MKTLFTLILVGFSLAVAGQGTDSLKVKKDSITSAIEKQKQELETLRAEKEKLEKEKDLKRQSVLSDKSISFDRTEMQSDIDKIVQPVFTPGKVEVSPGYMKTADGSKEALNLIIPEVAMDLVKKDWYKTIKKSTKSDVNEIGNSYSAYGVSIKNISSEPLDVQLDFSDKQEGVFVAAVFQKDSAVINKDNHPQIYASVESYLKRYGLETYKDKVRSDIKEEEKVYRDMKKELDKLIKKNEKEHKKISDNKLLIDAAEDELKLNDHEREQALENIQNKRNRVRQVSGKEAVKIAKKDVKRAVNKKKDLEKDRKKTYRSIVEYKSDIERANQAIDLNLQRQKEQTLFIYKQELKIKALEDKLELIK